MSALSVAIVGMGPRGMTVLERLVSMGRRFPRLPLTVHVIESGDMGCGVHQLDQPDYLLLNTVCGLPTMFPPRGHAADIEGESFFEWVKKQGGANLACCDGVANDDNKLSPSSYLPRALFGAYLKACFGEIKRQRPANVDIVTHTCDAVALLRDGSEECVECSDGTRVRSRFVVLTTGHTRNTRSSDGGIHNPYDFLADLGETTFDLNDRIGLAGFGLSSFDVLAGLTIGRGGMFRESHNGGLLYRRSGCEPLIYMFSRSGLPYFARPFRDDGAFAYDPLIFEANRIRSIRSANGSSGLDFLSTLQPLLAIELRAAYCRIKRQAAGRPIGDDDWIGLQMSDMATVANWLREAEHEVGAFDVGSFLGARNLALASGGEYQRSFVHLLEDDLRESRLGMEGSVEKYLAEVLLHLRESFNAAVDFRGLDARSHDYFFGSFAGTVRRLAIGPQPERSKELLALIQAGVVKIRFGPNPCVDRMPDGNFNITSRALVCPSSCVVSTLIRAQSPSPSFEQSDSPLLKYLARSGRVRKHRDDVQFDGGVEIDRLHHPVGRGGQVENSLFVLGPLCEGSIYYNTYVPTTVGWSRPFIEAEVVVGQIVRDAGLTQPFAGRIKHQSKHNVLS